jgi:hypothetical protein
MTIAHNCPWLSLMRTKLTVVIKPEAQGRFHWTKVLVDTLVLDGVLLFFSSSFDVPVLPAVS